MNNRPDVPATERLRMNWRFKDSVAYVAMKETRKAITRRIKLPQYLGNDFVCSICNTQLRAFKPIFKSFKRKTDEYGYIHALAAIETFNYEAYSCPACDGSDRERLYALYFDALFRTLDRGRRHRLVEFAPSSALRKRLRSHPSVEYRSADLYRSTVDDRLDITDMRPYEDNSIDIFLCSHILEHVPEDRLAIAEMFRALRPGGVAVVMVPIIHGMDETLEDPGINTPSLRWKYYGLDDHVRQYGKADFIERLAAVGFAVDQLDVSYFGEDAFRRAAIAADSVLYVARKPNRVAAN
jgi:SAM-dependent methyltransferase